MMRIVIDMQGAQTESRFRGIGRYTMSFAQAIVRNRSEHEIILALNGLFPDTIEPIRAAFDELLPKENIRVWYAPGPVRECEPDNESRRKVAESIREAFLASLAPDVIHICSLFEGFIDDAVTSIGHFDRTTSISVTLHDLIPLLNPDHYLKPHPRYAQYYQRKAEYLKRAATYLAVSESSRQEGLSYLDIPPSCVVNTSEAAEPHFQPLSLDEKIVITLRQKFGLTRPFLLYAGGTDDRKNLPRLIRAFAALAAPLRAGHQLLLAGKMPEATIAEFNRQAKTEGFKPGELCFTGYVTDEELVQLYNLCKLFVFPSWHEGFGLPALEAMACGAPVIGANTSSLPEVIGLDAAQFDPFDVGSITAAMAQALQDDAFRQMLREHGLQQVKKFSWDESAKRAIAAWESGLKSQKPQKNAAPPTGRKPKLAFVSPLPPERTGIADYSTELLPALADYYDIDVVVAQDRVGEVWGNRQGRIRDVSWLRANAGKIERVLYQMGNSPFHQHMLSLLREIPGTVVLHDFYMNGLMSWLELVAGAGHAWTEALYATHGYGAVFERFRNVEAAKLKYPVNLYILQHAQGVIVHSEHSRKLAQQWFGQAVSDGSIVIPHLRSPAETFDKAAARKQLGLCHDDFVVCSFGFLAPTKLNHRLLHCWLNSSLAKNHRCRLVFVGENHGGDYGAELLQTIHSTGFGSRIRITGFASPDMYRQYLMAANMAVQLRCSSRGETSGTVLDCMNHALPVIVNANGSMAELDADAVWMLPEEFEDAELIKALDGLWRDAEKRRVLGERAREIIVKHHAPAECARRYAETIEHFHRSAEVSTPALIRTIASQERFAPGNAELLHLSKSIAATLPLTRPAKRLFLDISATYRNDLKTGIERVARALVLALLGVAPAGYRVEPVYLCNAGGAWRYRYACRYTLSLLDCPSDVLADETVEPECGDVLFGLDISGDLLIGAESEGLYADYRNRGVMVYFMVHDLLPIRMPDVFPPGAAEGHTKWLRAVSRFDGAICVSRAVADEFAMWQKGVGLKWKDRRPFRIGWSHHGADIANTGATRGLPDSAEWTLRRLRARPTFLMVGTIEPRKAYLQVLDAFTQLWQENLEINLVVVGKEGWTDLPDGMRRDIPETVGLLLSHPEVGKRLFWLDGISDEYLEKVYASCTCLIVASYGEGFGLPLIEAAQHKLPIIARDIPVFREVAGKHAFYFKGNEPKVLANSIKKWLVLREQSYHPTSDDMPWLTWKESAAMLLQCLFGEGYSASENCMIARNDKEDSKKDRPIVSGALQQQNAFHLATRQ